MWLLNHILFYIGVGLGNSRPGGAFGANSSSVGVGFENFGSSNSSGNCNGMGNCNNGGGLNNRPLQIRDQEVHDNDEPTDNVDNDDPNEEIDNQTNKITSTEAPKKQDSNDQEKQKPSENESNKQDKESDNLPLNPQNTPNPNGWNRPFTLIGTSVTSNVPFVSQNYFSYSQIRKQNPDGSNLNGMESPIKEPAPSADKIEQNPQMNAEMPPKDSAPIMSTPNFITSNNYNNNRPQFTNDMNQIGPNQYGMNQFENSIPQFPIPNPQLSQYINPYNTPNYNVQSLPTQNMYPNAQNSPNQFNNYNPYYPYFGPLNSNDINNYGSPNVVASQSQLNSDNKKKPNNQPNQIVGTNDDPIKNSFNCIGENNCNRKPRLDKMH